MADEPDRAAGSGPPSFPTGAADGSDAPPPPSMPPPSAPSPPPPPLWYPPPQAGYGTAPATPGGSLYASWGLRLGGWLIDLAIFVVIQVVLEKLLHRSNALTLHYVMTRNGVVHHQRVNFMVLLITVSLWIVYATVLVGGPRGQTVGMMAVGIRAVRDGSQAVVGYGKAFARSLIEQVFRFTVIVWIVDMLFPLWDAKRQTLHDKIVGTVVLRTRFPG